MADLTQTASSVALGGARTPSRVVQYGESVTQGMPLYLNTTDGKYYQTDANDTALKADAKAIAMTPGLADGHGLVALPSSTPGISLVNLGATLTVGTAYVVSATKGAIAPVSDIGPGEYVSILGIATTTSLLDFQPSISNTAKA